jgi:hypothetical protein
MMFSMNEGEHHWETPMVACHRAGAILFATACPFVVMNTIRRMEEQRGYSEPESWIATLLPTSGCYLCYEHGYDNYYNTTHDVQDEEDNYFYHGFWEHKDTPSEPSINLLEKLKWVAALMLYPCCIGGCTYVLRVNAMHLLGIQSESPFHTFLKSCCCAPCALAQIEDELKIKGLPLSINSMEML